MSTASKVAKILWHNDFWDTSINGVAEFQGRKVYFMEVREKEQLDKDFGLVLRPVYGLYDLPNSMMQRLEECHKIFQKWMGYHTDHDPLYYHPCTLKSTEEIQSNYAAYQNEVAKVPPLTSEEINNHKKFICEVECCQLEWFHRPS